MAEQRITYRYRLFPTRVQVEMLSFHLSEACRLYNACIQERKEAWNINRERVNYYTQANQLKTIRANGDLSLPNFSACQAVLRRAEKAFQAFFCRVSKRQKPGFPRFKSRSRFNSLTFPSYGDGCRLIQSKIRLQGVGLIKVKLHRPISGTIKTTTIKRECGKWYVYFSVRQTSQPLPVSNEAIGLDVGLTHFATLSDGFEIRNPRYYRVAQTSLRVAQRRVARRKRGSHGRLEAVQLLQCAHAHVRNQRSNFHHHVARSLVNAYGLIAVEDLNFRGLASGMLAKSVNDAGWSGFIAKLDYKAENAGRTVVKVNPCGTSQTCLCGANVPKSLSQRWHECSSCGLSLSRDHVSAQVILRLGLSLCVPTWSATTCVTQKAIS